MFRTRMLRSFIIIVVALVFASTAYALAAGNTFSDATNSAGEGSDTISGYAVSNVKYTLDSSSPANVTQVEFDLDAPASTVSVSLSGEALQSCTESATVSDHWLCTITGVTATSATDLRVAAAQ